MLEHEFLKLCPLLKRGLGAPAHLHLKGQTQKQYILAHALKATILKVGYVIFQKRFRKLSRGRVPKQTCN